MDDRPDAVLLYQPSDERLVGDVAFHEHRFVRHRPAEAGREIVDHHHRPAGVEQGEHGVAADIAGSARHQHRRLFVPLAHSRVSKGIRVQQKSARIVTVPIRAA